MVFWAVTVAVLVVVLLCAWRYDRRHGVVRVERRRAADADVASSEAMVRGIVINHNPHGPSGPGGVSL